MESFSKIHRTMLTAKIFKVRHRPNLQGKHIPVWAWDRPVSPCGSIEEILPNEPILVFEPSLVGYTAETGKEESYLVLSRKGFAYLYFFDGTEFGDVLDECP